MGSGYTRDVPFTNLYLVMIYRLIRGIVMATTFSSIMPTGSIVKAKSLFSIGKGNNQETNLIAEVHRIAQKEPST